MDLHRMSKVIKKLVKSLKESNRNITCDRYFTSVPLFEELLKDNITAAGTVIPSRKHFLLALLPEQAKDREIGLSMIVVRDNLTMAS